MPPVIEDLEGGRPRTRAFPTVVPGVVGEEEPWGPFSVSRERSSVSARLSPGTPVYVVSDGDDDDDDDDSTVLSGGEKDWRTFQ